MDQLLKPTESLECLSKGDFDSQVARLSAHGLRSEADFDKYSALSMVQSVAREAHRLSHKASFFNAAVQSLRPRLQVLRDKVQAYFGFILV